MILVIDNYDSFTYNLVQLLGKFTTAITVRRNDAITVDGIADLSPQGIVISPGPGRPEEAGITIDAIKAFAGRTPIFGVCLGHQAIGQAFGGRVVHAPSIMHGRTSSIHHDGRTIFVGIEDGFTATRYHSLVVERSSVPPELEVSAWTSENVVMGLRHRTHDIEGVQFHPESILTNAGEQMLKNWLRGRRRA